jgi:hypothetical protein
MFGPDYTAACPSCSAIADGFNGYVIHLAVSARGTPHKMAEVVGVDFRLGKNSAVTRERVIATIRTGDNGHEWRLAADIVAHATRLEQERTNAHIISRQ